MRVDKHGLEIKGLKKVSGETKNCTYPGRTCHEIFYNKATGEVWTIYHASENEWTEYSDKDIISLGHHNYPMSMQEVADLIKSRVDIHKREMEMIEESDKRITEEGNKMLDEYIKSLEVKR